MYIYIYTIWYIYIFILYHDLVTAHNADLSAPRRRWKELRLSSRASMLLMTESAELCFLGTAPTQWVWVVAGHKKQPRQLLARHFWCLFFDVFNVAILREGTSWNAMPVDTASTKAKAAMLGAPIKLIPCWKIRLATHPPCGQQLHEFCWILNKEGDVYDCEILDIQCLALNYHELAMLSNH